MYETTIEPRVSETDGVGHINNTTIPVWFEAGRNEIFNLFTPDKSFDNWKMIIINMNVDYLKQVYFGEEVIIKTWVQQIGNSSLRLYEELWQNQNCCAKGSVTYVNYNLEEEKSEIIPEHIRHELVKHMYYSGESDTQ